MSIALPASPSHQGPRCASAPSSPVDPSTRPTSALAEPQTPASPALMSVAAHRYESPSIHACSSYAATTPQLTSSATSPSTVAMSTQPSQQPLLPLAGSAFATSAGLVGPPGASSDKSMTNGDDFDDGDVLMRLGDDDDPPEKMVSALVGEAAEEQHRRTDHDRQADEMDVEKPPDGTSPRSEARGPPKTEVTQGTMSRGGSTVPVRPGLERLQADVGPLYLLCRLPHPAVRPHPTQDLLSLYSLNPLAATVARTDPVTGEKRKIRKTYKGKIQAFGLAGRNQEVKHPEGQPGGLVEMMNWPEEEWQSQKVVGKELANGFDDLTLAKLERAMKMARGPLPDFDASVLGLDAPAPIPATTPASVLATASALASSGAASAPVAAEPRKAFLQPSANNVARQAPAQANKGTSTPTSHPSPAATAAAAAAAPNQGTTPSAPLDPARPKRAGKKRRYDDHSFEGYGEGFVDDDVEMGGAGGGTAGGGYSTSDREDRRNSSGAKKRKKNPDTTYPAAAAAAAATSGGVGAGSGPGPGGGGGEAGPPPPPPPPPPQPVSHHHQSSAPTPLPPPPTGLERGSYGVGMVGIGRSSGVGAYGAR